MAKKKDILDEEIKTEEVKTEQVDEAMAEEVSVEEVKTEQVDEAMAEEVSVEEVKTEENALYFENSNEEKAQEVGDGSVIICSQCGIELNNINDYVVFNNKGEKVILCNECDAKSTLKDKLLAQNKQNKLFFLSLILAGILSVGAFLTLFLLKPFNNSVLDIVIPIASIYLVFAFVSQLFWGKKVQTIFIFFIKPFMMPKITKEITVIGIIMYAFTITATAIIYFVLYVTMVLIGVAVTAISSMGLFPFALTKYIMNNSRIKKETASIKL